MTANGGTGVRQPYDKEASGGEEANPTPVPPTGFLPLRVERELVCGGFCWDGKRKAPEPMSFVGVKGADSRKGRYDPAAGLAYRTALRQKRLRYGIVKPKDESERAWLAEQQAAEKWLLGRAA